MEVVNVSYLLGNIKRRWPVLSDQYRLASVGGADAHSAGEEETFPEGKCQVTANEEREPKEKHPTLLTRRGSRSNPRATVKRSIRPRSTKRMFAFSSPLLTRNKL